MIEATSVTEKDAEALLDHIERIEKAAIDSRPEIKGNPFAEGNIDKIGPPIDTRPIVMADPKVQEIVNSRDISESHQALVQAWPHVRETFEKGTKKGIELGYIPADVESRIADVLDKTSIRLVDSAVMDTYGGMSAYYRNDNDEIGVSHNVREIGEGFLDNLIHELKHKASGGTFVPPQEGSSEYRRSRVGYSIELKPDGLTRTGLNEAVTQHITMGILTGDFETFDPDQRADGDRVYYRYRKVLATFINRSGGVVHVRTFTNGYFEDTGPEGGTKERRQLIREAREASGPGAMTKLDKLFDLSDLVDDARFDEVVLSRIHPLELDEQRHVVKQGYINTQNLPTFFDLYNTPQGQGNVL